MFAVYTNLHDGGVLDPIIMMSFWSVLLLLYELLPIHNLPLCTVFFILAFAPSLLQPKRLFHSLPPV